ANISVQEVCTHASPSAALNRLCSLGASAKIPLRHSLLTPGGTCGRFVTRCSAPLRALAHTGKCGARAGNHLGRIERRELAAALEDAAVDHDRVDGFRTGRFQHEMRGVGHYR